MLPAFKAVMFDMDGTLLKSMRYWRLTTLEFLLAHDIMPNAEQLSHMFITSTRKLCEQVLASNALEMPQEQITREVEAYMHRHYLYDVQVKPRVDEYLLSLKSRGVRMCVGTYAPKESAIAVLQRLKLLEFFEFVTDCYENGLTKFDTGYFDMIADRMGINTRELCVFEDSLPFLRTAALAGCSTVAVLDPTQIKDHDQLRCIADFTIGSCEELL